MIKFVFRWAFRLLVLALVLVIGLVLLKDTLIKEFTQRRIQRETGLQVRIGAMQTALFNSTVSIQDLVIYNPAEFGGGPFLDVPDLHLQYDYGNVGTDGFKLKLLRLDVRELSIVENNAGQTNILAILHKVAPDLLAKDEKDGTGTPGFGGIDMLNLSVGKVRYVNLRNPRRDQEVDVRMRNAIIQNIRTGDDMAGVFLKVLVQAGITIYFDPNGGGQARAETR